MYPEVNKVKKLSALLFGSIEKEYIPQEIKIPVVSSLGIKAVIKIG
jgi:hypothetical protein